MSSKIRSMQRHIAREQAENGKPQEVVDFPPEVRSKLAGWQCEIASLTAQIQVLENLQRNEVANQLREDGVPEDTWAKVHVDMLAGTYRLPPSDEPKKEAEA